MTFVQIESIFYCGDDTEWMSESCVFNQRAGSDLQPALFIETANIFSLIVTNYSALPFVTEEIYLYHSFASAFYATILTQVRV